MREMKIRLRTLAVILVVIVVLPIGFTIALSYLTIPSGGRFVTAPNLTALPSSIDWGNITQGSTTPIQRQVTLTNTGQQDTGSLQLSFGANAYGIVTWDGAGAILVGGGSRLFNFTFTPFDTATPGVFSIPLTIGET